MYAVKPSTLFAHIKSQVLSVVSAIPEGRVTTYGAIAMHLGVTPRHVARVLATLSDKESASIPWFRVVGARGFVSSTKLGTIGRRQITRLRAEGVSVTSRSKVGDFETVFWSPGWGISDARSLRVGSN
jgi:methylated-DNA-protein-cysteine methyltransferase-like protein